MLCLLFYYGNNSFQELLFILNSLLLFKILSPRPKKNNTLMEIPDINAAVRRPKDFWWRYKKFSLLYYLMLQTEV